MFTGIVEQRGSVVSVESANGGMRLVLDTGTLPGIELGGSIWVNGVCLTGVETGPGRVAVDVVKETLSRSTLAELQPGDPVNLVMVTLVLVLVTMMASWFPARRATTVDPAVALRHE